MALKQAAPQSLPLDFRSPILRRSSAVLVNSTQAHETRRKVNWRKNGANCRFFSKERHSHILHTLGAMPRLPAQELSKFLIPKTKTAAMLK